MDKLQIRILELIRDKFTVEPVTIPQDLEKISFPLGLLTIRCYNWKSAKIRKIYCMRMSLKIPSLEYLGMAIYPNDFYDIPIFYLDLSFMKKKAIAYINYVPMLYSAEYENKYIEPLKTIHAKYKHIPRREYPQWMTQYTSAYTIYSMPPKEYLQDLKGCGIDYLRLYLELLDTAQMIQDSGYQQKIEEARQNYILSMLKNDVTAKMLGKIVGKKRAKRIFHEVLT